MLSAIGLLQDAQLESGLNDFGSMEFAEGLNILVTAINNEAGLTAENETRYRLALLRLLVNRLRMQRDIARHPEILDEEILPPVFITSLPRTGSTKLHRLLAATGDFNAMKFWQVFNFARVDDGPAVDPDPAPDPREALAREFLDWFKTRSSQAHEAHPMYWDEAEEETFLLDASFSSPYWHVAFLEVPSYIEWCLRCDPHQGFNDVRRILQYMQWQYFRGQKRRWILKTPTTLGREGVFDDVFKGTDFIVTHRHPEKIVASSCATVSGTRQLYNDTDYSHATAEHVLYGFGETSQYHLQWRAQHPAEKVLDVRFEDVIGNEMALLATIYRFLGMSFTETSRRNVQAWLDKDARRGRPPGRFTLAEYGVTPAQVNERFAGYIARYQAFL